MEWVETTGATVEEATDAALDRLGVDEQDAEIEVLAEPERRLLGLVKSDARVRARVIPKAPRPKKERPRRQRGRRRGGEGDRGGQRSGSSGASNQDRGADDGSTGESTSAGQGGGRSRRRSRGTGGQAPAPEPAVEQAATAADQPSPTRAAASPPADRPTPEEPMTDAATLDDQTETATAFLEGLIESFDAEATIERVDLDDETVELQIRGEGLGVLIGPRGSTLQSLNEILRAVLQKETDGNAEGRVRVDVGGYREKRREALERFAVAQAEQALETGEEIALEPMNAADRKTVHDAINEVEGVVTRSEGADPRRWVVIAPTE